MTASLAIENLPPDWSSVALRYVARINERSLPDDTPTDTPIRYFDIGSVASDGYRKPPVDMVFEDAPSRARRLAKVGDVAVSTVRTYLRAITFVDEPARDAVWSTGFAILSPREGVDSRFLYYVARSACFVGEIQRRSVGVSYPAVSASDLASIRCPLPPLNNQRRIADALDREIARLDQLAQLNGEVRSRLEERWRAIIRHTAAGGDEDVQLRRVVRVVSGGTPTADEENWNGAVTWLTPADLGDLGRDGGMHVKGSARTLTQEGLRTGSSLIPRRSIVLSVRAPIGHLAIADEPVAFNQGCKGLVPRRDVDERFLYYQLLSRREELEARGQGSTFAELSADSLASLRVELPPLDEQGRIADALDGEWEHNYALVSRLDRHLDLLEERRDALITAAVTGELDPSDLGKVAA